MRKAAPMSLATRCSACGTAFRVVQDQLKVSEGWVRCGRCNEVFNALEGLFDLERETPPEWQKRPTEGTIDAGDSTDSTASESKETQDLVAPTEGTASWQSADPGARAEAIDPYLEEGWGLESEEPASAIPGDPDRPDDVWEEETSEGATSLDAEIDAHLFGARRTVKRRAPAVHVSERDRLDFSDARFASDLLADAADSETPDDASRAARSAAMPLESSASTPEFVRRAESRARWHRPRMRAALTFATMLLLAGLLLQVGTHFRDLVAARWPTLAPPFVQWCALASCTIEAPRRIEDITVESTALARAPGSDNFRLAVTLRSHGSVPVAMPWIDLSLTDASGKLVARKALAAREFDPHATLLQPGAEIALHALLAARDTQVTGYTVEIFYP